MNFSNKDMVVIGYVFGPVSQFRSYCGNAIGGVIAQS